MDKEDQIEQLKLPMQRLDEGVNVDAGVQLKNATSSYTRPNMAARERETFFRGTPQMLGLSDDLPEPGSFLTTSDLGVPVLATRDKTGTFRAFLNVCRHRCVVLEADWDIMRGTFPVYYLFQSVQINVSPFGVILVRPFPDPKEVGLSPLETYDG